jgi:hypothetical protein
MCDSDKYALCHMYPSFKQLIKSQLSIDSLREVGIDMQGKSIITNGYIQQLYRYFRLSSFTNSTPFDLVNYLRDTIVYRLVVIGERAKRAINDMLN